MSLEARSESLPQQKETGLAPWAVAELPAPPVAKGLNILGVIGPGVIMLGVSIGSGEWLLGPAAFVQYGLTLLWVAVAAIFLQAVFNTEIVRYTMYTGEPIFTGFMRTKPGSTFWAWAYMLMYFFQAGWPGWAGTSAGAIFYLFAGRLAGPVHANAVYVIGAATFLLCVIILLFGQRIERTLEVLNWMLIVFILGGLLLLCLWFVPASQWWQALGGFFGFDLRAGSFNFFPAGADWFLIGAFAAYSGGGGVVNLMLANWTRDKGFGMGQVAGYIPAALAPNQKPLAHTGSIFAITPQSLARWKAWWRIALLDQWGIFFVGAILGMALPGLLYTALIRPGQDIRGLAVAAELANAMMARGEVILAFSVALLGAWVLFKTQLDIVEGMTRAVTDILWAASRQARRWCKGEVRIVYYSVLAAMVVWGLIALRLTQPIILLQMSANMAGVVFVVAALHVLYLNTHFLPRELQPPLWRRASLIAMALFYGAFVYLWLLGGWTPDPAKGFLFNLYKYLGF
jgi:Mn2+/Fe2+ NRAMP family transporter